MAKQVIKKGFDVTVWYFEPTPPGNVQDKWNLIVASGVQNYMDALSIRNQWRDGMLKEMADSWAGADMPAGSTEFSCGTSVQPRWEIIDAP